MFFYFEVDQHFCIAVPVIGFQTFRHSNNYFAIVLHMVSGQNDISSVWLILRKHIYVLCTQNVNENLIYKGIQKESNRQQRFNSCKFQFKKSLSFSSIIKIVSISSCPEILHIYIYTRYIYIYTVYIYILCIYVTV